MSSKTGNNGKPVGEGALKVAAEAETRQQRYCGTSMTDAYQILVDCPNCLVEGAVAELLDPQIAGRVAVESLCRLCGRECALGELVFSGRRFESRMDARRALAEWATREGEASVDAFCAANFGGMDADEAALALIEGRPIASNFDVFTHLFSNHVQATQTRSRTNVQRRATLADLPAGQDLVQAPADGSMRETAIETPRADRFRRSGWWPVPCRPCWLPMVESAAISFDSWPRHFPTWSCRH